VNQPEQPNIEWIDLLRVKALFAVIMLHASAVLLSQYGKVPFGDWLTADIYNALTRFAVPVFVMITGALLLNRDYELTGFLKKRLGRIILPFIFWSLVYIAYSFYNEEFVVSADNWVNVKLILHQLKYGSSYHLWYVYMLIGLYLLIPVISKFVRHATRQEIHYFLLVWLVVMLFSQSYLSRYKPPIELRYFEGFVGYLVLGHYLAYRSFYQKYKLLWLYIIFLLALAVIVTGTWLLTSEQKAISTVFYEPVSPFVILLSASAFLILRFTHIALPAVMKQIINFTGKYAYGIYLSHALVLYVLENFGLSYNAFTPAISILATAFSCLVLSTILVWLLNKLPFIGKYISG
jgi:surface polysaccharide O-acyltransferase-like enzyme